ncbi:MAG: DUF488 domain-containing protein [Candidatus Methanomethyliaceae archaeon]|nr:DUF488 domain-containing protein [Candidatus Methanomethyliaceae archaeon]MDW7970731.1 DUF488 domain-containing protein [Nitrososphaerota archaeon]
MPPRIWTMGYGSKNKEKVIYMLKSNGIELVVDIRRWPTSRKEGFKKEELERWLKDNGIDYYWLGELLGGYRSGGFEKYMESQNFKEGMRKLLEIAFKKRTCILCLEESPKACHRRFIAEYLKREGFEIAHI